jgi:hypothetical protein
MGHLHTTDIGIHNGAVIGALSGGEHRLRSVNPIVVQALTIAGVLLGSAATFVVTSTTERTRWRRAQSARWDDKRLVAYSEYANAVKHMVRLCRRIAETKGLLSTGQPIDLDSAFAALAEAKTHRACFMKVDESCTELPGVTPGRGVPT